MPGGRRHPGWLGALVVAGMLLTTFAPGRPVAAAGAEAGPRACIENPFTKVRAAPLPRRARSAAGRGELHRQRRDRLRLGLTTLTDAMFRLEEYRQRVG